MWSNSFFVWSYIALWVLVAVLYVAVFLLYRHFGEQLLQGQMERQRILDLQGPKLNEPIDATLITIDDSDYQLIGRGHVVLFSAPGCSYCTQVQPIVRDVSKSHDVGLIVAYKADAAGAKDYAEVLSPAAVVIADPKNEFAKKWNVRATPYFVATDSKGNVRMKGPASTRDEVGDFFKAAAQTRNPVT